MTFHSIERLASPFHSVAEVGLVIPPLSQGEAKVYNDEFKLLFFLEANCIMAIDGAGEFRVRSGDILVMPRAGYQRYRIGEKGHQVRVHALKVVIALPPLPLAGTAAQTRARGGDPEKDLRAFVRHHFTETVFLPQAQKAAMNEIMREIRVEAEHHRPGIRHRVSALCADLTVHVARQLHDSPAKASATAPSYGTLVNQTKEYLLRNYARPLTLAEIAWHVRKSEEHLARVFRKVTGQTIFDYLRTVRLENVKTLLIDSDKTLSEIAESTGFSSLALFSRCFTQYVGQSASNYRKERALTALWRPHRKGTPNSGEMPAIAR